MTTACACASSHTEEFNTAVIAEVIKEAHALYDHLYNSRRLEEVVDSIYAEDCCVMMEGHDVIRGRKALLDLLSRFSRDPCHHRVESQAIEIREITPPGRRVYELGRYSFYDVPNTGRADGNHVIVWTKIDGKYMISLQSINPVT